MLVYWLMFAVPSFFALIEQPRDHMRERFDLRWVLVIVALIVIMGFRWETGGDWGNYNLLVRNAFAIQKPPSLTTEPFFYAITNYAAVSPYGMLVVTMTTSIIFAVTLVFFCLDQPRPWLCLSVAVPYFVVVMGMGYIRQGVAISLILMGLNSLKYGRVLRYELWVLASAMFHASAFIFVPLGLFVSTTNIAVRGLLGVAAAAMLAYVASSTRADTYVTNYVEAEASSSGATIRLLMTAITAAIFLAFRSRFDLPKLQRNVWTMMCWASLATLPALVALSSSTVVDRMALYLLPVQCFIYSRVPSVLGDNDRTEKLITAGILALYAVVFFVWLNYADNIYMWLPYRSWLFEDDICLDC